jgi:hypothetical protein
MKDNGPYTDDLDLALNIADYADAVTMADFGSLTLEVETKADDRPCARSWSTIARATPCTARSSVPRAAGRGSG